MQTAIGTSSSFLFERRLGFVNGEDDDAAPEQARNGTTLDRRLCDYVSEHGPANWKLVAAHIGTGRTTNSCRQRWFEFHQTDIRKGDFTHEEILTILLLHSKWGGNRWSRIAKDLPERTSNQIKNFRNTKLKKKVNKLNSAEEMIQFIKSMAKRVDSSSISPTAYDELITLLPHLATEAGSATAEAASALVAIASGTTMASS